MTEQRSDRRADKSVSKFIKNVVLIVGSLSILGTAIYSIATTDAQVKINTYRLDAIEQVTPAIKDDIRDLKVYVETVKGDVAVIRGVQEIQLKQLERIERKLDK